MFREPALGDVGQERRDLGAARRDGAEREADERSPQPRLPRASEVLAANPRTRELPSTDVTEMKASTITAK
jgi:hypothetical protein